MTGWNFFLEKRARSTMGQVLQRFVIMGNSSAPAVCHGVEILRAGLPKSGMEIKQGNVVPAA